MGKGLIEQMLSDMGGKFSRELGIDLTGNSPEEIPKWFFAGRGGMPPVRFAISAGRGMRARRRKSVNFDRFLRKALSR